MKRRKNQLFLNFFRFFFDLLLTLKIFCRIIIPHRKKYAGSPRDGPGGPKHMNERMQLGMNIYVGNLPYSTTPDELREVFAAFGEVAAARIVSDRETGRAKGFGFVEMPNDDDARKAIEALNGNEIGGRKAVVNEARPREARPPRNF